MELVGGACAFLGDIEADSEIGTLFKKRPITHYDFSEMKEELARFHIESKGATFEQSMLYKGFEYIFDMLTEGDRALSTEALLGMGSLKVVIMEILHREESPYHKEWSAFLTEARSYDTPERKQKRSLERKLGILSVDTEERRSSTITIEDCRSSSTTKRKHPYIMPATYVSKDGYTRPDPKRAWEENCDKEDEDRPRNPTPISACRSLEDLDRDDLSLTPPAVFSEPELKSSFADLEAIEKDCPEHHQKELKTISDQPSCCIVS